MNPSPALQTSPAPPTTRRGRGFSLSKDSKRRAQSPRPDLPSDSPNVPGTGSQAGSRKPSLALPQSNVPLLRSKSSDTTEHYFSSNITSHPRNLPSNGVLENGSHGFSPLDDGLAALSRATSRESPLRSDQNGSLSMEHPSATGHARNATIAVHNVSANQHGRALSRRPSHQLSEVNSVGVFAIEHLFASFVSEADVKITSASIPSPTMMDVPVEQICGPGADPKFDQLLSSMGHVSSKTPTVLIDKLFGWMKKNDVPHDGIAAPSYDPRGTAGHQQVGQKAPIQLKQQGEYAAERKSRVAKYIVCRGFQEVLKQTQLSQPLYQRLQHVTHILFISQDNVASKDLLSKEPLLRAYADMVSETLACVSNLYFDLVGTKYLRTLNELQQNLSVKGELHEEAEDKANAYLRNMRFLRLKVDTEHWPGSCEFLSQLSSNFGQVHGHNAKVAYCRLIGQLLLPVAAAKTLPDLSVPAWRNIFFPLLDRLSQLSSKPKYWHHAFPVVATLTCLAPSEVFQSRVHTVIGSTQQKLRERLNRPVILKSICRLVWTYIKRTTDSAPAKTRHLDDIARMVFWSGKKYSLLNEPSIAEPLIQLTRIISWGTLEVGFRNIILSALNAEQSATKEVRVESLEPDRVVVGVRAFLAIVRDVERGEDPPFPITFVDEHALDLTLRPLSPNQQLKVHAMKQPSVIKEETSRKAIDTASFAEPLRSYCEAFCKLFGKVAVACDNHFSTQSSTEEKPTTVTAKPPLTMTWRFPKDETANAGDDRSSFYDLLHVIVQASPRCLTSTLPINPLLNLLCNCATQPDTIVATSAANSLKSIAFHGHAQAVVARFSSFIASPEHRRAAITDSDFFNSGHVGGNWHLFEELLLTWHSEVKNKLKKAADAESGSLNAVARSNLDTSATWTEIDRVECHGLLFLCSPSSQVRKLAVRILDIVCMFDQTLGQQHTRIMRILETNSQHIIDTLNTQSLTLGERSRLQRGIKSGNISGLLREISGSEETGDVGLWDKLFPHLIRFCSDACPMAIAQTREDVCARLSQMQLVIQSIDERWAQDHPERQTQHVIDCWRLYLTFACITILKTGSSQSAEQQHTRKSSQQSQKMSSDSFTSATDLFGKVVPMLSAQNPMIRNAAVAGLGSINVNLYKPLLELLGPDTRLTVGDKSQPTHARSTSSPRRFVTEDASRTEVVNVFKHTAPFLNHIPILEDTWILAQVSYCVRETYKFLNKLEIERVERPQEHGNFQKLRIHFCGLLEIFYTGISKAENPSDWMTFLERKAMFVLLEEWCGYSAQTYQTRQRTTSGPRPPHLGDKSRANTEAFVLVESKDLSDAALSAMAALCNGPLSIEKKTGTLETFNTDRMLLWIDKLLNDPADRRHTIGRRALKNIIVCNLSQAQLLNKAIEKFYLASTQKGLEGYVDVVAEILVDERAAPTIHLWKVISACLVTLGNKGHSIRMRSGRLLRFYEEQHGGASKLYDLDISISDKTTAVNKLAQFEISQRLAVQHPDQAVFVLSEISAYFSKLDSDSQRNLVGALLPWIQTIELQVDPKGLPTASSYVVLMDLLEITMKCSQTLHHEIQALWKALASGPHGGNVQSVMDFIIALCLANKDHSLLPFAKQIVVHLSTTPAGQKVMDFLLMHLTKKNMASGSALIVTEPSDIMHFPYVPTLSQFTSEGNRPSGIYLGHLSLILLVDLVVSPVNLAAEHVPRLLQTILILWDHHVEAVREHAREMLVHLIHEVVLTKLSAEAIQAHLQEVENFVETIRRQEPGVVWTYDDNVGRQSSFQLAPAMPSVVQQTVKIFALAHPNIGATLASQALDWALTCHVRHLACRSLQIHRCLLPQLDRHLDQQIIIEMLPRLSSTISDDDSEVQVYAAELIRAYRSMIDLYSPRSTERCILSSLLWTTAACMESVHEWEFMEAMEMFETLLTKVDFTDPVNIGKLEDCKPDKWNSNANGVPGLIHKGCRSQETLGISVRVLNRLVVLPTSAATGDDSRVLFTLLANLPAVLNELKIEQTVNKHFIKTCLRIPLLRSYPELTILFEKLDTSRFTGEPSELLSSVTKAINASFFPQMELPVLTFLFGLLSNPLAWFKLEVLDILRYVTSIIDMRKPEIINEGPDLVSPLLRLLNTPEFCFSALKVMDNVVTLGGTKLDNQLLRMSMIGSRTDRATRKQYERVKSHYGIPEISGWSVPAPADQKEATRSNLYELYSSLIDISAIKPAGQRTPEVEFLKNEYSPGSYFPVRKDTTGSEETAVGESTMEDIVARLTSLDDFFENDDYNETSPQSANSTPSSYFRPSPVEKQRRSPFHKPDFSTSRRIQVPPNQQQIREPVMSPSAFHAASTKPNRPPMLARSATSPAVEQMTLANTAAPFPKGDDHGQEPFSDDETLLVRANTGEKLTYPIDTNPTKAIPRANSIRSNFQTRFKKLTSKSPTPRHDQSPEVPKVPDAYLPNPRSSEP